MTDGQMDKPWMLLADGLAGRPPGRLFLGEEAHSAGPWASAQKLFERSLWEAFNELPGQ